MFFLLARALQGAERSILTEAYMRHTIPVAIGIILTACSLSADSGTGGGSGSNAYQCQLFQVASPLGVHLRERPSLSSQSILVVRYGAFADDKNAYAEDPEFGPDPVIRYGQVWRYVVAAGRGGWMLERATDGSFRNLVCADGLYDDDAGYDGGYDDDAGDAGY